MKLLNYIFLLFIIKNTMANDNNLELYFECGGKFKIEREFTLSDGSKYSQFSNYGTCSGNLGIYNSSYCFGTFKTNNSVVINSEFLCENTYSDNNKSWITAKRIPNTEIGSSIGEMLFIDGTGKWKSLVGTKCKYGIKFINMPDYSSTFSSHKCNISEKQKNIILETE